MSTRQGHLIDGYNLLAPAYDITADIITVGLHRYWRNIFCNYYLKKTPKKSNILDIATGTGDILFRTILKRPDIHATGLDLSEKMLEIAKQKQHKQSIFFKNKINFVLGNALQLPFENNLFQSVTLCWAIRSLKPIQGALREALRVLKPNGKLFILEHGLPEIPRVRAILNQVSPSIPILGTKLTHAKILHPLYTTTVDGFSSGKNFVAELHDAGFFKVTSKSYSGGIITIYEAQKSGKI